MKPLIIILVVLLLILQYKLWFSCNGIVQAFQLNQKISKQKIIINNLQKRNAILSADIKALKHSKDAIELKARNDLGMIEKGETFYRIVK